jgi:hypothetical protein
MRRREPARSPGCLVPDHLIPQATARYRRTRVRAGPCVRSRHVHSAVDRFCAGTHAHLPHCSACLQVTTCAPCLLLKGLQSATKITLLACHGRSRRSAHSSKTANKQTASRWCARAFQVDRHGTTMSVEPPSTGALRHVYSQRGSSPRCPTSSNPMANRSCGLGTRLRSSSSKGSGWS